jgi:hypothetical protein
MNAKRLWLIVFLCVGSLLAAQELSVITLYFAPATGGSPEDREFFDHNLPGEIRGSYYRVVDSEEEADFVVASIINEHGGADSSTRFTMGLLTAADSAPLLELSWDYRDPHEMYLWDIGGILAPVVPENSGAARALAWRRQTLRFYAGLRGGVSLIGRSFQEAPQYSAGRSAGISLGGGLVMEFRLLRYLSLQVEGDFLYETFNAPRVSAAGDNLRHSTDVFSSLSFVFPLFVKVPLKFGNFVLSPYAGGYYLLSPWGVKRTSGAAEGEEGSVFSSRIDPPVGFAAGIDLGFIAGPGEFFADLRYGSNLGTTVTGDQEGPRYIWDRANLCLGYKFGF